MGKLQFGLFLVIEDWSWLLNRKGEMVVIRNWSHSTVTWEESLKEGFSRSDCPMGASRRDRLDDSDQCEKTKLGSGGYIPCGWGLSCIGTFRKWAEQ